MIDLQEPFHQHNLTTCFLYWYKYAPYVLVCFAAIETQLDHFSQFMDDIHSKLIFTTETRLTVV